MPTSEALKEQPPKHTTVLSLIVRLWLFKKEKHLPPFMRNTNRELALPPSYAKEINSLAFRTGLWL